MNYLFYLSWQHFRFYRGRSLSLIFALVLLFLFPWCVFILTQHLRDHFLHRAKRVDLIVGPKGSPLDLCLRGLHYTETLDPQIPLKSVEQLNQTYKAEYLPLITQFEVFPSKQELETTAPLIGTPIDFFSKLDLELQSGRYFIQMGEVVVGSNLAQRNGIQPGDSLLSVPSTRFDLASGLQLKLKVTGILKYTGQIDDEAVYTDLKTCWILNGDGHGHQGEHSKGKENAVPRHLEVNSNNISDFHFHTPEKDRLVSFLIVYPKTKKDHTMLITHLSLHPLWTAAEPSIVMKRLVQSVFKIEQFLRINSLLTFSSALLFIGLILYLSIKLRKDEFDTLKRIGSSSGSLFSILLIELSMILLFALSITFALGLFLHTQANHILYWMVSSFT